MKDKLDAILSKWVGHHVSPESIRQIREEIFAIADDVFILAETTRCVVCKGSLVKGGMAIEEGEPWFCLACLEKHIRPLTKDLQRPIPMILTCPAQGCGARHIDAGRFAIHPHHTHSCQACGFTWRPAVEPTVGVQFLPGFKDAPAEPFPPEQDWREIAWRLRKQLQALQDKIALAPQEVQDALDEHPRHSKAKPVNLTGDIK